MNLRLLMAGLPESGKTTFLAALYEVVGNGSAIDGALRLSTQPADREYLFEINQTWLKLEQLGHSNISAPRHVELPLVGANGSFDLNIPDVVGETFLQGWEGAHWPAELVDIATGIDGILLFAHGGRVVKPVRLTPSAECASVNSVEGDDPVSANPDWNPSEAPTQTMLADLLEGLYDANDRLLPTAVVVSAWDAVQAALTPQLWLELNMPLLWQMLAGRDGVPPYEVFGVSAQGGDVNDASERSRLAAIQPPRDRVFVQTGELRSGDISAPVRWLLDAAQ